MTIKERIKKLANSEGLSIPKLEEELGFGGGTISRWDKSAPSADKLSKIADRYGVSVDYLLGRTQTTNSGEDDIVTDETIETEEPDEIDLRMLDEIKKKNPMLLPKTETYTTDYIYSLPEGTRAELIDGVIYDMALPSFRHQDISFSLARKIADYIDSHNGNCKVMLAPFAVFLNNDNRNYVEPDISVICDKNKLDDRGCNGAPDWIIEVVSPSSRRMDYGIKLFKYRTAGVYEYWVVDPAKDRIMVYNFETGDALEYTFSDSVKVNLYEDFEIDFSKF